MIQLGGAPVHTENNVDYQRFAKQTPNFTPKSVKLGVLNLIRLIISLYLQIYIKIGYLTSQ